MQWIACDGKFSAGLHQACCACPAGRPRRSGPHACLMDIPANPSYISSPRGHALSAHMVLTATFRLLYSGEAGFQRWVVW